VGHAEIKNRTPFAFEMNFTTDEEGTPVAVLIIKATYEISERGHLVLAEKQHPVNLAGQHWGKPEESSYKYEPEGCFIKSATDIVWIGSAHAQRVNDTQVEVELRIANMRKKVRVTGDRYWVKKLGVTCASSPEPFERIPLLYERSFGGWDRSHIDAEKHSCDLRNPVGTGYRTKHGRFEEGVRLPNLEDPWQRVMAYGDVVPPEGFGFLSPDWQPRAKLAGTYGEAWFRDRHPLLPADFDRRFFNAASDGLVAESYLEGDEPVSISNASPGGYLAFCLPSVPPPAFRVRQKEIAVADLESKLDTVILNTDENLVYLIWRAHIPLKNGPHDVLSVHVAERGFGAQRGVT
jgi:hypothetical protein